MLALQALIQSTLSGVFAIQLLDGGLGIEFVQDHLGHINIQNTLIYAKLTSRRREAVYRQVEDSPEIVKV